MDAFGKLSEAILSDVIVIAERATEKQYRQWPELTTRYASIGREKTLNDNIFHLQHLASAIRFRQTELFCDYMNWCKVLFTSLHMPLVYFTESIVILRDTLTQMVEPAEARIVVQYVNLGLESFSKKPSVPAGMVSDPSPVAVSAYMFMNALLRHDRVSASQMIDDLIAGGMGIKDIYLQIFQPSQIEIGRLWQENKISVADEHYCTAATQLIMSRLYPQIFTGRKNGRSMLATCVSGDLHEIGIRMIADFFELEGWNTIYLGANTPTESIVKSLQTGTADLLAISCTMSYHLPKVQDLIAAIRAEEQLRGTVIMTGGYPFNVDKELYKKIGADCYAANAVDALQVVKTIIPF
ncbi:MAG: cobalamin-dependent protein [Ignavibacteria bacterium]|nr:cobalamin-dependent protein [Ignavibacteria bacterium]